MVLRRKATEEGGSEKKALKKEIGVIGVVLAIVFIVTIVLVVVLRQKFRKDTSPLNENTSVRYEINVNAVSGL